jgi:hypothetical protein
MLAEAAAARYFYDRGSKQWFLVMVSDFNQDSKERLQPEEISFLDAYEAQRFASLTPPAVLRLRSNDRVIIKIKHAVSKGQVADLPQLPAQLLELVSPARNARLSSQARTAFSWRWNGKTPPENYRVVVTKLDAPPGTALSKSTQATALTPDKPLAAGRYRWQVYAVTKRDPVASLAVPFSVKGQAEIGWFLVVLALAGAFVGLLVWLNRRRRRVGDET